MMASNCHFYGTLHDYKIKASQEHKLEPAQRLLADAYSFSYILLCGRRSYTAAEYLCK
jgi:hypothetical protein